MGSLLEKAKSNMLNLTNQEIKAIYKLSNSFNNSLKLTIEVYIPNHPRQMIRVDFKMRNLTNTQKSNPANCK